jgi:CBS domain-containing protein
LRWRNRSCCDDVKIIGNQQGATMGLDSMVVRQLVTVERDASLQHAAVLMREHHVGSVVVTHAAPDALQVVGIVTDRDLAVEAVAKGLDVAGVTVGSLIGGRPLHSVAEDADVGTAIALMQSAGVRRLLVRDREGHLCGLVSFDDLLQSLATQLGGLAGVLPRAVEREAAERARAAVPPAPPRVRVPAMGTAGWVAPAAWGLGRGPTPA